MSYFHSMLFWPLLAVHFTKRVALLQINISVNIEFCHGYVVLALAVIEFVQIVISLS